MQPHTGIYYVGHNKLFKAGLLYSFVKCIWQCLLFEILSYYSDGGEWRLCLVRYDAVPIGEFFLHFWMFEDDVATSDEVVGTVYQWMWYYLPERLQCFLCFYIVYISSYWLFYLKGGIESKCCWGCKPSDSCKRHRCVFSPVFYHDC